MSSEQISVLESFEQMKDDPAVQRLMAFITQELQRELHEVIRWQLTRYVSFPDKFSVDFADAYYVGTISSPTGTLTLTASKPLQGY